MEIISVVLSDPPLYIVTPQNLYFIFFSEMRSKAIIGQNFIFSNSNSNNNFSPLRLENSFYGTEIHIQ